MEQKRKNRSINKTKKTIEENFQLAEQVKRLVKTEYELYNTQLELDKQIILYRALYDISKKLSTYFKKNLILKEMGNFIIDHLNYGGYFVVERRKTSLKIIQHDGCCRNLKKLPGVMDIGRLILIYKNIADCNDNHILLEDAKKNELSKEACGLFGLTEFAMYPFYIEGEIKPAYMLVVGNPEDNQFFSKMKLNDIMIIGLGNLVSLTAHVLNNVTHYQQLIEERKSLEEKVKERTEDLNQALTDSKINHEKLENTHQLLKDNQKKLLISEKMASVGRLTAGIAHEINTPLASARASLSELSNLINEYSYSISVPDITIEDHKEIAEDMKKSVFLAEKEIDRIAGFVRSIKLQTVYPSREKETVFNINGLINDTILFLNHVMLRKNISIIYDDPGKVELFGMPGRMNQALTNVVTNSIESFENTDTESPKPEKHTRKITIEIFSECDDIEIRIKDNGCGISDENLSKIFDPMFTTKPFGRSAGMGLTMVHDIIYGEFGGTINVESRINVGTTITLRLPKKRN